MGLVADRVRETTTTTGTGNITLAGAASGFRTFASVIPLNVWTYYAIVSADGSAWEVGKGYLSDSTTLVRSEVYASTNAGALVSFAAGTKDVFITAPAERISAFAPRGRLEALRFGMVLP